MMLYLRPGLKDLVNSQVLKKLSISKDFEAICSVYNKISLTRNKTKCTVFILSNTAYKKIAYKKKSDKSNVSQSAITVRSYKKALKTITLKMLC